jgi:Lipopolysaccharide kinase (Kdo/WaaP) family.
MKYVIKVSNEYDNMREYFDNIQQIFENDATCVTLHKQRNVVKYVPKEDIVIKRFVKISLFNRIMYSFFRKSKAERSWRNAHKLIKLGIGTPYPVAYIEIKKYGFLLDSYYICKNCSWQSVQSVFLNKPCESSLFIVDACLKFIVDLHKKGVLHFDLNPANILYNEHEGFNLIDLNRMSFKKSYRVNKAIRNLTRMTENPDMYYYIVCKYAEIAGINPYKAMRIGAKMRLKREFHYKIKKYIKG